ncbi:MAG TPA: hypothetical protein VD902_07415, partial [Symbiobacteriaceae bacterium]|nr:hypothetical protein [Symbiobacteriaceae bacterium]
IDHAGYGIVNTCLVNNAPISEPILQKYRARNATPVVIDVKESQRFGVDVVQVNLVGTESEYVRHNPDRLAWHIARLFLDRRVHLERTPWDFFMLRQRLEERGVQEEMR